MRRFFSEEIRLFLAAVDHYLSDPFEIEVIGGAAAALMIEFESDTEDIDTTTSVSEIAYALEAAREATGLAIPVGIAGVWDAPYEYRKRRKRVRLPGIERLHIYVPEKHDWALMKIVRAKEKDLQHIREVARRVGFKPQIFLHRFVGEMFHVIGSKRELVHNFLAVMDDLYGEEETERMREVIAKDRRWKGDLG